MRTKVSVFLLCLQLAALAGCEKRATTQQSSGAQATASPANQEPAQAKFDACRLILKEEIEAIQGSPIKESKSSVRSDGDFRVSQCFYTAAEFNQSVSLAVTQSDSDSPTKRSPKDFWEETFGHYGGEIKEGQGDKEKKGEPRRPGRNQRERGPIHSTEKDSGRRRRSLLGRQSLWWRALCFEEGY